MKGRNTTCITIRLEDSVVKSLEERATKQGMSSVGGYIKAQILKSILPDRSGSTIPVYDKYKHKAGDRVLVRRGKRMVEAVVPELDASGNIIPEF